MQYEIKGTPLPVVICTLGAGETIETEKGAMSWMSPNMQMATNGGGSIGKAFSRAFSGESMFQNTYTAVGGQGLIAFASSFPGQILAVQVTPDRPIIAQKCAFLARESSVDMSIFFQKKIGAGFFGGEGFIMQKFSGNGIVFLEIDGSLIDYQLAAGQSMLIDTGYLAVMDPTITVEVESIKGIGNVLLGGEGLFNTKVTGPGRIWVQTMPRNQLAGSVAPYIATGK